MVQGLVDEHVGGPPSIRSVRKWVSWDFRKRALGFGVLIRGLGL
jgi:hypothetical protein